MLKTFLKILAGLGLLTVSGMLVLNLTRTPLFQEAQSVAPTATSAPLPPTALSYAAPTATAGALGASNVALGISQAPFGTVFHGPPPFTLTLQGNLLPGVSATCRSVVWEWGDGTDETQSCLSNGVSPSDQAQPNDSILSYQAEHTYSRPGLYYARLRMTTGSGDLVSESQPVLVGSSPPADPGAGGLYWGLWTLALVVAATALWALGRWRSRFRLAGYVIVALGLLTFVPPFSYLPNPAGLVWSRALYSYDPRLPFVDRFVVAGDPAAALRPTLDALIGLTGLDPLDPAHPLLRYEFLGVSTNVPPYGTVGSTLVKVRMTYEGGGQRTYDIPAGGYVDDIFGFYWHNWRADGLGRVRTDHEAVPGIPFAGPDAPVRLGIPQPLALPPQADRLGTGSPASWEVNYVAGERLALSPRGDALLRTQATDYDHRALWLVKLDGNAPIKVTDDPAFAAWSPDGRYFVYGPGKQQGLVVMSADGSARREVPNLPIIAPPGLTAEGIWYLAQDTIWIAPWDGGQPRQLLAPQRQVLGLVRPSADGTHVAYVCSAGICIEDRAGGTVAQATVNADELVWSPDGQMLAAVEGDTQQHWPQRPVTLTLLRRDGTILHRTQIAPNGEAGAVQWTADSTRLFAQTFPNGGRRIVTVDAASGTALDLTPPRWDPLFSLAAAGHSLVLTNGRGGFWTSAILDK